MANCKPGKRKCAECGRCKTIKNFSYRKTKCNLCYRSSDAYRNQRDRYLRSNYGITADEYDQLLEAQGGGCAICGGQSGGKHLAVDHDHDTMKVRGLLCKRHNSAIARWIRNANEAEGALRHLSHGASWVDEILGREVRVPE